jgi:uncharacterized membrane protein YqjE
MESEYEFTPEQNDQIARLSNAMRWVSVPMLALAALCLVNLIMGIVWLVQTKSYQDWHADGTILYLLFSTLLFFAFGIWTSRSSLEFQQITETRGQDISHLMGALDGLRKVYGVLATFVKVFIAITLLALVLNLIAAFSEYRQKQISQSESAPAAKP